MADSHRLERIAHLVQVQMALLLQREVRDPRLAHVTVTGVEVSRDLSYAKVFYTVAKDDDAKAVITALKKAAPFLRRNLADKIDLRVTPELQFKLDQSLEYGNRIADLLKDIPETSDDDKKND